MRLRPAKSLGGTDSGGEGRTRAYCQRISVALVPVSRGGRRLHLNGTPFGRSARYGRLVPKRVRNWAKSKALMNPSPSMSSHSMYAAWPVELPKALRNEP